MVPSSEDLSEGRGLWYIEERQRGPIGPGGGILREGPGRQGPLKRIGLQRACRIPGSFAFFPELEVKLLEGFDPWSDKMDLKTSL